MKSCPHDNVDINLRAWCADLDAVREPRRDEAALALVMLSLTSFHGLTMTRAWHDLLGWATGASGLPWRAAFTGGMAAILFVPGAQFPAASALARRLGATPRRGGPGAVAAA